MSESIFSHNSDFTTYGTDPAAEAEHHHHHEDLETVLLHTQPRGKNWPRCIPFLRHNISMDVPLLYQTFCKRAYFGWTLGAIAILYNLLAATVLWGMSIISVLSVLWAVLMLAGIALTFLNYFTLYYALRKERGFAMVVWFFFFAITILYDIACAVGFKSGGVGALEVYEADQKKNLAGTIIASISMILWVILSLYNIVLIFRAGTVEYKLLGGHKGAMQSAGQTATEVAYDNRENIKQFAVDNKEAIQQYAVDHKDEIRQFAVDNREVIGQAAYQNRATLYEVGRAALDEQRPYQ